MDVVGCGRLCSVLISMYGFGILLIASGCFQISSCGIAPNPPPGYRSVYKLSNMERQNSKEE